MALNLTRPDYQAQRKKAFTITGNFARTKIKISMIIVVWITFHSLKGKFYNPSEICIAKQKNIHSEPKYILLDIHRCSYF